MIKGTQRGWRLVVKRTLDVIVAFSLIVLLSPIFLVVAALVAVFLGRPVVFRQARPGRGARPFVLLKFRTMRHAADVHGVALPDEQRLTAFGRFLRAVSLDELPQFFNVLRGELSLVGPRPLLMQYLERYSPEQARRHEVLPGITGWAQINGRNALTWDEKFKLDVWYVDHWSLVLDVQIILKTIATLARRHGISNPGSVTMPEFMGGGADRR